MFIIDLKNRPCGKWVVLEKMLGWRDSNPRITGPKPVALPLGYTPMCENI